MKRNVGKKVVKNMNNIFNLFKNHLNVFVYLFVFLFTLFLVGSSQKSYADPAYLADVNTSILMTVTPKNISSECAQSHSGL